MTRSIFVFLGGFAACVLLLGVLAANWSPTAPAPEIDVYYPGSEAIAPDEMRVVALGTGMPSPGPSRRQPAGW